MDRILKISDLNVGDVILEHTKFNPKEDKVSILSALIRYFTKNYWNHAKYIVESKNRLRVQEALAQGIVERDLEDALLGRDILIMRTVTPLTKVQKSNFSSLAERLVGVKYDYLGTLFFQLIKQLTGKWYGTRDLSFNKAKYCSEAPMFLYYNVTGIIKKPWGYSPADIRKESYFKPIWAGIVKRIDK